MRYLHTMVRVADLDGSLDFYFNPLGMKEVRRFENQKGRFTLISSPRPRTAERRHRKSPCLELTFNSDPEDYNGGRNFGHLAYEVDNIYDTCKRLTDNGVTINRPPRDGNMASSNRRTESGSKSCRRARRRKGEPWLSMANTGSW